MKFVAVCVLAMAGLAAADLSGNAYVRDLLAESTTRGYEKNDATGDFICEPGYTGADCSLLKCPYSPSFVGGKSADWLYTAANGRPAETTGSDADAFTATSIITNSFDNNHVYKECGGRGVCDRSSGECKCFDSFTGEGCRRTTCPNDCSGHGVCQTDALAYYSYEGLYGNEVEGTSDSRTWGSRWNWDKYSQCKCDRGFEGHDCSNRICPHGDDPETQCSDELAHDVQSVSVSGTGSDDYFTLQFTDQFGGVYSTRPILFASGDADTNEIAVQTALEALPNFAVPTVEIDITSTTTSGTGTTATADYSFDVNFVDASTTNYQKLLTVNSRQHGGSCDEGGQPKFDVQTSGSVSRGSSSDDLKEASECGGRGLCDRSTGLCECFDGYYGESCSSITTYI